MASIDDFLVVAGTAAPVIALANVVLVPPTLLAGRAFVRLRSEPVQPSIASTIKLGRTTAYVAVYGSLLNYVVQTAVLLYALSFLAPGSNAEPTPAVQRLMTLGVALGLAALIIIIMALFFAQLAQGYLTGLGEQKPGPGLRSRPAAPGRGVRPTWQRRARRANPSGSSPASGK